jgi:hypothetical protein
MPQPKIYSNSAKRQAAFRRRRKQELAALYAAKGLPPLPQIATMPGWSRWRKVLDQAEESLRNVRQEMQDYYDDRSEQWQESGKAGEFTEKMDAVEQLVDQVAECRSQIE